MKIKIVETTYSKVAALKKPVRRRPKKPNILFRTLIRVLSLPTLWSTRFEFHKIGMEKIGKEPCLILMNHSSFTDMKIAYGIFFPKPFAIVGTTDALIGKNWLLRQIGIIPTQKFVTDAALVKDMIRAVRDTKMSVIMYPEAGIPLTAEQRFCQIHWVSFAK